MVQVLDEGLLHSYFGRKLERGRGCPLWIDLGQVRSPLRFDSDGSLYYIDDRRERTLYLREDETIRLSLDGPDGEYSKYVVKCTRFNLDGE